MNYYEHHLGDWAKDVRGLSMTEEGAYRRLLDVYYSAEEPLPGDEQECFDLAGTRDAKDMAAVRKVLRKFFVLADDGCHHQKRADAEIERFRARAEKAKRAASARWNAPARASNRNANASPEHVPKHMHTDSDSNAPPMRTHESSMAGAMHSQSPVTSNQTPEETPVGVSPHTSAGEATKAMREAGIADANPGNPVLLALLSQGITVEELRSAAATAVVKAEGANRFGYALTVAQNERAKAARVKLAEPNEWTKLHAEVAARPSVLDMTPEEREAVYGPDAARY